MLRFLGRAGRGSLRLGSVGVGVTLAALLLGSCGGTERAANGEKSLEDMGDNSLVVFDLSSGVPETAQSKSWMPAPVEHTYAGLLRTLTELSANPKVKGVLVRIGTSAFSWPQTEELGRQFQLLRKSGKPVVCHADSVGNASAWLLATACDHSWLSPAGDVDTVGIAGEAIYLKGFLERFKVHAQFLHVGKFKSASEMFTEDHPSEASEESMRFVLGSIRDSWLKGMEQSAKDPRAKEAVENGPWDPESARSFGIVEAVGYESDARKQLEELTQAGSKDYVSAYGVRSSKSGASRIAEVLRMVTGTEPSESGAHVAVLPAVGGIAMVGGSAVSDDGITADAMGRAIRRLKQDKSVKAVVLRIDSPGGSALASDLLWHELMLLREKKPLIVSVGTMAASGGYYMACAANRIFAEQTSIVGSIGVLGGKFAIGETLGEVGISTHLFAAADGEVAQRRAAYSSMFQLWDEPTKERITHQMEQVYQLFLKRVAEGRNMPVEKVHEVGQGRIWTGSHGLERGLVDQLGGLADAITYAKEQAGLKPNATVTVEGGSNPILELLGVEGGATEEQTRAATARYLATQPSWYSLLNGNERRLVQSILPMLSGEQVLLATSFVVAPQ